MLSEQHVPNYGACPEMEHFLAQWEALVAKENRIFVFICSWPLGVIFKSDSLWILNIHVNDLSTTVCISNETITS